EEITSGAFRQDLYYRINVISILLPPLRDRREDIPVLTEYFHTQLNERFHRAAPPLSRETLQIFQTRNWPGNIRELENWMARYVILGSGEDLANKILPKSAHPSPR